MDRIVVVGGGQAAASLVIALRQWGYSGQLTLISDEDSLPYQRPPLSKAYLKGELQDARLLLKTRDWYANNNIELLLGRRVKEIDRPERYVVLDDSTPLPYDVLVLATGSRARRLSIPGADGQNVFTLRSLGDVERIKPRIVSGGRLVVIGAGYIGLEAASAARSKGMHVSVIEYAPRVLARVTSPAISAFYEKIHTERGVKLYTGAQVQSLKTSGDLVNGVVLHTGETLPADMLIVGIGIDPNVDLAAHSGIVCDNGIVVDHDARTSDKRIFAIGDCASRPLVHYGDRHARLESVHNAIEQGKQAAAAIVGRLRPTDDCPWFWSDQYEFKLQISGINAGYDQLIARGEPGSKHFAVFYLKDERLLACDAVNSPQEFLLSKKLIVTGYPVDANHLGNPLISMKSIVEESAAKSGSRVRQ